MDAILVFAGHAYIVAVASALVDKPNCIRQDARQRGPMTTSPQLDAQGREIMYPIAFETSDGKRYFVDWRDIDEAMRRDPDGRTLPSGDVNVLQLTADDCVFLWLNGIGF